MREAFHKAVTFTFSSKAYTGCGKFLADNNIYNKWLLEKIGTAAILPEDFNRIPMLQFDDAAKKVSGNDGCNSISGRAEVQGNRIQFGSLISTKMACMKKSIEGIIGSLVSGKLVNYYFRDGKLFLYLEDDSLLVFKKHNCKLLLLIAIVTTFILHKIQIMLDQFQDLIKQFSGNAIVNNPDVPNEQNEAVEKEAGSSIINSLKRMVSGGNIGDITSLFKGQSESEISNHPVTKNVSSDLISNLMGKFGLNNAQAGGIASSLLPGLLSKFVHKTNDPNDSSFNMQSIMSSLGGGGGSLTGMLDKNHDGKVNLDDVKSLFGK